MTSVTIPNSVTKIGKSAFSGCNSLTNVNIPNSVTTIGDSAFYGCTRLISVSIPNSVTTIGGEAFRNAAHIFNLCHASGSPWGAHRVSGYFEDELFYDDSTKTFLTFCSPGLQNVTIPNTVTTIGEGAFSYCTSLTSANIPRSITYVGNQAFAGTKIDSIIIPENVRVGSEAFRGCSRASYLSFGYGSTAPRDAFYGCTGLRTLVFDAAKFTKDFVPKNVKEGITSLTLGEHVSTVEDTAFRSFSNLESIVFNAEYCTRMVDTTRSLAAFARCRKVTRLVIGPRVKLIPPGSFGSLFSVTDFIWGDSVEVVGAYAFDGTFPFWDQMQRVNLDLTNCIRLEHHAFSDCLFDTITIGKNFAYIGEYGLDGSANVMVYGATNVKNTFKYGNIKINTLVIQDNVTDINPSMFERCGIGSILMSVDNRLRTIGSNAFADNGNMAGHIVVPNIKELGSSAFRGCGRLSSVEMGNELSAIGSRTFEGCDHITNVTLGRGVTTIAADAFSGCTEIRRITSRAFNPPVVDRGTFEDVDDNITLNVPCVAVEAYQNAPYWSHFNNIEGQFDWLFSATSSDINLGSVTVIQTPSCFNRQAQIQANPYYGFVFSHWSDGSRQNPRYMVVTSDTLITAIFVADPDMPQDTSGTEGISSASLPDGVRTYSAGGQVVVEGASGLPVRLYDVRGRMVSVRHGAHDPLRITVPSTGIYIVRIGNYHVQRIAVLR